MLRKHRRNSPGLPRYQFLRPWLFSTAEARLELLDSAGFGVGMGLSVLTQADYDASWRHSRSGREGASLQPPTQRPAGALLAGRSPYCGPREGGSTAERARASRSALQEARARSRGSSRSEHDAATERTRSGGVAGLPQTSQNVTRVSSPAWRY